MQDELGNERLIALDTETTGLETADGHRIIEIGAIEIINRRITKNKYQTYLQPQTPVGSSIRIHGISDEFLENKPLFSDISTHFLHYIKNATLIIHNAAFDLEFLNNELRLIGQKTTIEDHVKVIDTIELSKSIQPRAQHSLDALARRYEIDLSKRQYHGALLDARILAQVYLAMTGGQGEMFVHFLNQADDTVFKRAKKQNLRVISANKAEQKAHEDYLKLLALRIPIRYQ